MARIGQPRNLPARFGVGAVVAAVVIGGAVLVNTPQDAPQPLQGTAVVSGDFRDGFEPADAGGAPVPPVEVPLPPVADAGACPAPPGGFSRVDKTWTQLWAYGYPCSRMEYCERNLRAYPNAQSYPAPIGANKGTYVVVPFVPNAGQSVNLYFDQVQSRAQIAYNQRPARGMFITVSNCPGDFRPVDNSSENPFLHSGCRMFENGGSLIWASSPSAAGCHTAAGLPVFLNIIAADPEGGIEPGEHSCADVPNSASGCDVGAVVGLGPG